MNKILSSPKKPNIFIGSGIPKELVHAYFKIAEEPVGLSGLLVRSNISKDQISEIIINNLKTLKAIGRVGSGLDNIPESVEGKTLQELGISLFNTPDEIAESVAQHALALLLNQIRNISNSTSKISEPGTQDLSQRSYKEKYLNLKKHYVNHELNSAHKVVIVGAGSIGMRLAKLLQLAFNITPVFKVRNEDRVGPTQQKWEAFCKLQGIAVGSVGIDASKNALNEADTVFICSPPPSPKDDKLFPSKDFKTGAIVIDMGRPDGLLDRDDTVAALKSHHIQMSADIPRQELTGLAIQSCHLGASTPEANTRATLAAIEKLSVLLAQ